MTHICRHKQQLICTVGGSGKGAGKLNRIEAAQGRCLRLPILIAQFGGKCKD